MEQEIIERAEKLQKYLESLSIPELDYNIKACEELLKIFRG
jgi:hypothetical protein